MKDLYQKDIIKIKSIYHEYAEPENASSKMISLHCIAHSLVSNFSPTPQMVSNVSKYK